MKQVKCIEGFLIDVVDGDGFTVEESGLEVEEGTIWVIDEDNFRVVGGEVRLTNDELGWIEISQETLGEYFEGV